MAEPHLVGIYDADGTVRGELTYLMQRTRGTAHCSLCDITHGFIRRRSDFDEAAARLPMRLDLHHRDEIGDEWRAAAGGRFPCILVIGDDAPAPLLGPEAVDACAGDPTALVAAIEAALADRALRRS